MRPAIGLLVFAALAAVALPARAADDEFELWLNPSASAGLDVRTSVELETAQRFRNAPADDTYYARLWLHREVTGDVELSAGAERRFEGADEETRLLRQLTVGVGALGLRTRIEQRFVSSDPRTGWRLRRRVGASTPLGGANSGWALVANVEGAFTLRSGDAGGRTGLTGLRTFFGAERRLSRLEVSLGYVRQQAIRDGAPDRIGHAPFVGLEFAL